MTTLLGIGFRQQRYIRVLLIAKGIPLDSYDRTKRGGIQIFFFFEKNINLFQCIVQLEIRYELLNMLYSERKSRAKQNLFSCICVIDI